MRRGPRENGPRSPGGGSSHSRMFYPTIVSVSPISGAVGESLNIYGTNFINVKSVVIDGVSASFLVLSQTQIATEFTGSQTGSSVDVRVTTAYNAATALSGVWLSGSAEAALTFTQTVEQYSPVIWYRCGQTSEQSIIDSSGNNRHASWVAGDGGDVLYQQSTVMVTEPGNTSMRGLNTFNAYFRYSEGSSFIANQSGFTVIWVHRPASMTAGDNGFILGSWSVWQNSDGSMTMDHVNITSPAGTTEIDQYAMLAITMTGGTSGTVAKIYKNGVEVASKAYDSWFLGANTLTWNPIQSWDGFLDEFMIFDSDIGADAILEIYESAVQ